MVSLPSNPLIIYNPVEYRLRRAVYELPVQPRALVFELEVGRRTYSVRTQFRESEEGGWVLDITEDLDLPSPLVRGVPLVAGLDLLYQYDHHSFDFALVVVCRDGRTTPTFESLGVEDKLYLIRDEWILMTDLK